MPRLPVPGSREGRGDEDGTERRPGTAGCCHSKACCSDSLFRPHRCTVRLSRATFLVNASVVYTTVVTIATAPLSWNSSVKGLHPPTPEDRPRYSACPAGTSWIASNESGGDVGIHAARELGVTVSPRRVPCISKGAVVEPMPAVDATISGGDGRWNCSYKRSAPAFVP